MQLTALSLALTRIGLGGFGVGSSLNLDFTSGNRTLDPRITFSRASNATVTGPDGTLQYAPHNLLTYSEQFDNASGWSQNLVTVSGNTSVAPNGTTTADKVVATAAFGAHNVASAPGVVSGNSYTFSFYAKAGEYQFASLLFASAGFGTNTLDIFNIALGLVVSNISGTATITPVGGGWYRCSATRTASASVNSTFQIRALDSSVGNDYTGDGTSGIYIWGAQLNVGALQPYYPTTVKNLLGYTQEFDNAAWAKSNSFVQTNLLTWSEQFDNAAWLKTNTTVTANVISAPDGSTTADKIEATASAPTSLFQSLAFTGSACTGSVYVKKGSGANDANRFYIRDNTAATTLLAVAIDYDTRAITYVVGTTGADVVDVGNGWLRVTLSVASGLVSGNNLRFGVCFIGNNETAGEFAYAWGAQLVQGSTPGDYQRTEGTARAVMYPAPDGSRTADKLVEDTSTGNHVLQSAAVTLTAAPTTFSVFVKEDGRDWVAFRVQGVTRAYFNISTGTVGTVDASTTASITSVGDKWYRCSITLTPSAGAANIFIRLATANGTDSYTGDGTSGIYIWGAQLSDSASLDPYVYNPGAAPASAAYYGPRFDYDPVTLAPRGLLIEEQRTNSIRNNTMQGAVAGTPGTLPTNWQKAEVSSLSIAVAGTGVEDGISYVDFRVTGTASATSSSNIQFEQNSAVSATTGQTWTVSGYVSVVAGSTSGISAIRLGWEERSAAFLAVVQGVITPQVGGALKSARSFFTGTNANVSTTFMKPFFSFTPINGATIDVTFRIGMPQLEQGAFVTSVIPTTTAAATRAADVAVMQGANFSNWYRQDEGTLFVDYYERAFGATHQMLYVSSGASSERIAIQANSSNVLDAQIVSGGTDTFGGNTPTLSEGSYKIALAYVANNAGVSSNGSTVTTDTSVTLPVGVSQINLGATLNTQFLNSTIKRLAYFPRRLSNAELQGITS